MGLHLELMRKIRERDRTPSGAERQMMSCLWGHEQITASYAIPSYEAKIFAGIGITNPSTSNVIRRPISFGEEVESNKKINNNKHDGEIPLFR